ncbi:hypothetical protein ABZ330_21800 [Streptomyces sp. NPDC006172]|uniref:hypothetical protein n=1 Tax=Streptomyces sp. NPDC006172 TaxID=3154470 RepID=UPI0033DE756C
MADGFRFSSHRRAIRDLLKASSTRRLIEERTRAIEAEAKRAAEPDAGQFRTDLAEEGSRVRGAVIGDYATSDPAESRRALLRGLEGGRT